MDLARATYIVRRTVFWNYIRCAAHKRRQYGPHWREVLKGIAYLSNDTKRFNICASFLQNHGLIGSQIEGFEYFMDHLLREVINENSDVFVETPGKCRVDKVSFIAPTVRRPECKENNGTIHDIDPNEAQVRKMTYECTVLVDVKHDHMQYENEDFEGTPVVTTHLYRNVSLAKIPCMVKSKYCHWYGKDMDVADHGGYFVISGHQKNMIMLQKMRTNWPVIRHITKKPSPRVTMAEIRSASGKWRSTSTLMLKACSAGGQLRTNVFFNVPFVLKGTSPLDIPLTVILKILRIESIEDQFDCICPDPDSIDPRVVETLKHVLHVPESQMTRDEAFQYIFKYGTGSCKDKTEESRKYYILHILGNEFLPHQSTVGVEAEQQTVRRGAWSGRMRQHQKKQYTIDEIEKACSQKAIYIGFTIVRLLYTYLGLSPEDDRDHYSNKRLDSPAPLMAYHFRLVYRTFLRQLVPALSKTLEKCPSVIDTIRTKSKAISIAMREPYKRGNWSLQPGINTGVVQTLERISPQASLALCRRIMTPLKKEGKIPLPRQLHLSQYAINCCAETPEGQACGLILVLAMYARVGRGVPTAVMKRVIRENFGPTSKTHPLLTFIEGSRMPGTKDTLVFVNGTFFAVTIQPEMLEAAIVSMRRSQNLAFETRVVWDRHTYMKRYLFINTDCSVAIRPVYCVDRLHRLYDVVATTGASPMLWQRLLQAGVIEYIDKEEEDARRLLIATFAKDLRNTTKPYTHVEIDPTNILGLMGNLIPFSDHNQSPRNMYWTSQGRQALSVASLANRRSGLHQYVLNYPQKPLVATRLDRHVTKSVGGITMGNECVWAIMCFDGRNMEDSIYLKKSALERGLFRTTYYKQFVTEARTKGGEEESIEIPDEHCLHRKGRANYSKLGPDGIVPVGEYVVQGDVLIGKVARVPDEFDQDGNQIAQKRDRSVVMNKLESGYVDKVTITTAGADGHPLIRVDIRQTRQPEVGDKYVFSLPLSSIDSCSNLFFLLMQICVAPRAEGHSGCDNTG